MLTSSCHCVIVSFFVSRPRRIESYSFTVILLLEWFREWFPSKQLKAGHYRLTSETPFEWRFAGGPIEARDCMYACWV